MGRNQKYFYAIQDDGTKPHAFVTLSGRNDWIKEKPDKRRSMTQKERFKFYTQRGRKYYRGEKKEQMRISDEFNTTE
jgi:hypothetical protein